MAKVRSLAARSAGSNITRKVVFCIPTVTKPYPQFLAALEASVPVLEAVGWETQSVYKVGCPYISAARNELLRKALDVSPDAIVFLDHDLSWRPEDLLTLVETEGELVAGTYRFKDDDERYMGHLMTGVGGVPVVREDGCVKAYDAPAGFLKITPTTVDRFMGAYPELVYGERYHPCVDLFNHGAHKGQWYGEDYALCRNWRDLGGEVWIVPDLNLTHHQQDPDTPGRYLDFPGNFHEFLLRQPGGSEHPETKNGNLSAA